MVLGVSFSAANRSVKMEKALASNGCGNTAIPTRKTPIGTAKLAFIEKSLNRAVFWEFLKIRFKLGTKRAFLSLYGSIKPYSVFL